MSPIKQTRFKLSVACIALGLAEALLKVFLTAFPIVELYGFQLAIAGYFLTVKTINNIKENGNGQTVD
jgi:hypothetical protein